MILCQKLTIVFMAALVLAPGAFDARADLGIRCGTSLITTGDHDDRVVPAHSFKFAAELQSKQNGTNPTLIRIETNAGHGAGTPVSKTIEQYADIFGFTLYNMGIENLSE